VRRNRPAFVGDAAAVERLRETSDCLTPTARWRMGCSLKWRRARRSGVAQLATAASTTWTTFRAAAVTEESLSAPRAIRVARC
jgi:hypothetical protein